MERLGFTLPPFTRVAWASDGARDVWAPRLQRVRDAWLDVEWLTVAEGLRACAVLSLAPDALAARAARWAARSLWACPVPAAAAGSAAAPRHAIMTSAHLSAFARAWEAGDHQEMGRLLGCPECCLGFYRRVWVEEGLHDTTWPMAAATARPAPDLRTIEVGGPPQANVLWRWLGIRAVPHLPCRFDCPATVALADRCVEIGRRAGYAEEMDWLLDVLSWPVEWSALHGIAEVRTPILKICTRTDATGPKYAVQRAGDGYPVEGARGVQFPYRLSRPPLLTLSRGFQRGLKNPIEPVAAAPRAAPRPGGAEKQGTILAETLHHLQSRGAVAEKALRALHLDAYFTVVELDDGSVGACMSYHRLSGPLRADVEARLKEALPADPLLLGWLFGGEPRPSWPLPPEEDRRLRHALGTAVLSALSAPLLRAGGDATFTTTAPHDVVAGVRRAVVVGFGGLLEPLALAPDVTDLHVSDLSHGARKAEMDAAVAKYLERCPGKRITVSDGHDTAVRLRTADMVAITGSALANGTLEALLQAAEGCPRIIVQGQSAAIHPKALFDRGVEIVMTTLKPAALALLAASEASAAEMQALLEGGLPWLYLRPRQPPPRPAPPAPAPRRP